MTENQAKEQLTRAGYGVTTSTSWNGEELLLSWPGHGPIGVLFCHHGEVADREVEMFIEHAEKHRL
jgi:hypothetical protein